MVSEGGSLVVLSEGASLVVVSEGGSPVVLSESSCPAAGQGPLPGVTPLAAESWV